MRISLGGALIFVLSGIALFGVGLARTDVYYIASGLLVFFLGTIFAGIVLGKCVGKEIVEEVRTAVQSRPPAAILSANPVLKKNKSDTNLELMGHMDEETP
jgi:hypothetical protein